MSLLHFSRLAISRPMKLNSIRIISTCLSAKQLHRQSRQLLLSLFVDWWKTDNSSLRGLAHLNVSDWCAVVESAGQQTIRLWQSADAQLLLALWFYVRGNWKLSSNGYSSCIKEFILSHYKMFNLIILH